MPAPPAEAALVALPRAVTDPPLLAHSRSQDVQYAAARGEVSEWLQAC